MQSNLFSLTFVHESQNQLGVLRFVGLLLFGQPHAMFDKAEIRVEFKEVREFKAISFREKNKENMLLAITSNDRRE